MLLDKIFWGLGPGEVFFFRLSEFFFYPLLGRARFRGRCWAAIRLSHRPEPSGRAVHGEVDWTLEDDMVDGLFFCITLTGRRGGHTPYVQAGAETSDTGAEAVKPDPSSSWEGHFRGCVYRYLELKCGVLWGCPPTPRSINDPPTVPHVCCCCQRSWWVAVRRVQMGVLDLRRGATALVGRVSAEWSRCPGSMAQRLRDSVAPLEGCPVV